MKEETIQGYLYRRAGERYDEICEYQRNNMESVTHPKHYNQGNIEVIEFIEDQKLSYHSGQVIKYLCRAGKKTSDPLEDAMKAKWYLDRLIEVVNADREGRKAIRPNDMNPRKK